MPSEQKGAMVQGKLIKLGLLALVTDRPSIPKGDGSGPR